jgi:type IV secretion system protein VirB4
MPGTLLDGYAAMSDIEFGREVVSVSGPNRVLFSANLSLNGNPPNATSRVLEVLMSLAAEIRITHVVKCLGQRKAAKLVGEITNYYQMTQTSFFQKAVSRLTKTEPTPNPGRAELYQSCLAAQARTMEENLGWVQHAFTVTVMDEALNGLEKRVNEVLRTVNTASFIRERLGLKASFLSTISGYWHTQKRLNLINVELLADCTPMLTVGAGQPKSQFLSEIYDQTMPAMSSFRTTLGTSFNFNPHVGQTGHALLVMPSGGGKTTFVNFCLTQFQRYPDAQVVIFDRDWSCRIITGLVGGTHIDIRDKPVRLNPMAAIRQGQDGMRWAREFLVRIIEDGGLKTTHDDRNTIDEKLRQLAESGAELSLSRVAHVLPTHLHAALQEWLGDGPFGFFDSTEDDLQISTWTCIEMKRFMSIDRMARAFMDHAYRVLSGRLGAKPTFIYIEEASFLLNNPLFLSALDDWLKTFRKLNAFVWLTMQSPESVSGIAGERIRATLADNIPNIILGFNQRLENHRDLYKRMFALTDEQVNLIGIRSLRRLQNQDSMRKCSRRTMPTNCTIVCCCRQLENANCKRFLARLLSKNTIGLRICVLSGTRFEDLSGSMQRESVLNCSCGASGLAKRRNSTKP